MLTAILVSQTLGLLATLVLVVLGGQPAPTATALVWAGAAGLVGFVGLSAFYYALARGTMGIVTPLAALIGAGVPVAIAIAFGEQVGPLRLLGVAIGLVAVVLISLPPEPRTAQERSAIRIDVADLPIVVVAGLGFAGFFLFIDRALLDGADMWWALAGVRAIGLLAALALVGALIGVQRSRGRRAADLFALAGLRRMGLLLAVPLIAAAGLGDLGGNGFFVLARAEDLLSVAVVLSSLYPVVTTILAAALLHERMSRLQLSGAAIAVLAVVLIGAG